jgi:hypothetical protein
MNGLREKDDSLFCPAGAGRHSGMKLKRILLAFVFLYLIGCTPKGRITGPGSGGRTLGDYLPLKVGNSWTYSAFAVNGSGDTSLSGPLVLSIFQTNVLIGGQPNAFVVRTSDQHGTISYLAFSVSGNTLLHYLGGSKTFPLQDNSISWVPGSAGGAVVAVNQTQKYHISDHSGTSGSYMIWRPPDTSIALAAMISPDTLQLRGVIEGQTALTLKAAGGGEGDTMTVVVAARTDVPSSVTSPFLPWIPLWQLTDSSSARSTYTRDTTYSFKCVADNAECSDQLSYTLTNSYLGQESVEVQNVPVLCDRFRTNITVIETITYTDTIQTRVLFSGLSTAFGIEMWLSRGVGFVKGIAGGNSLPPVAAMGGDVDTAGALNGYYISPRVVYAAVPVSGGSYRQFFYVNDSALAIMGTLNEFALQKKNF